MTAIERGDHVTMRNIPGVRHGEVQAVRSGRLIIDPPEVEVRWCDGGWKTYSAHRFVSMGWGNWKLER